MEKMITTFNLQLIQAQFLYFVENRFRCFIEINHTTYSCYVASSSSLKKYIFFSDHPTCYVYKQNRKYTLFSIEFNGKQLIVDFKIINKIFAKNIKSKHLLFEKKILDYRCDIYDENKKDIYEIKAVLSVQNECVYPDKNSFRIYKQLERLAKLQNEYNIKIIFILLCPLNKKINFTDKIKQAISEFYNLEILFCYCLFQIGKGIELKTANVESNLWRALC